MNKQLERLMQDVLSYYCNPDLDAFRVPLSAMAAHNLKGQPVWPVLIGPPSSLKTTILNGLKGAPNTHFVDQLTARTFISGHMSDPGKPRTEPASLLHRVGSSGVIVIPDFSTITALRPADRDTVLSDLRRIFDGELRKEFGHTDNPQDRCWQGRITLLAAGTPEMETATGVAQSLGERFVKVRVARPDLQAAIMAMQQDGPAAESALREGYKRVLDSLEPMEPSFTSNQLARIAALAELVVRGRTHVQRDSKERGLIACEPAIEGAPRCAQQLIQLARGHALLEGRAELNEADIALAQRVGFDSMIPERRKVFEAIIAGKPLTAAGLVRSTAHYRAGDLEAVGLVESTLGNKYELTELAKDLLDRINPDAVALQEVA